MLVVNLVVTEECNLGCKYCYMKNKKQYMNTETVDLFLKNIDYLLKEFNEKKYSITFFGGEPLLNWDIIEYTIDKTKNDKRLDNIVLITNGLLLTEDKIKWLWDNNINVSVSFDGLGNLNNRVFLNGNSSIDYYLNNKKLFERISPKIMISPDSIDHMCDNYDFFIREFGNYFPDFTLVRDDIWSKEDIEKFKKELHKLTEKQIQNIKDGKKTLVGFFALAFGDIIGNYTYSKRHFGCFAGVNGLAIFPNNKIYPCGRFGSADRFQLYEMKEDDIVKFDNIIKNNPALYDPHVIDKCKDCDIFQYCNAGCSFSQICGNDENATCKPVDCVCELYKIIYEEFTCMWNEMKENKTFKETLMMLSKRRGN